jgi:hypothetical protein
MGKLAAGRADAASSEHWRSISPLQNQLFEVRRSIARSTWSEGVAKNWMKRKDVLAGDGRGTDEDPCLGSPSDEDGLGYRSGGSQLHQNDSGHGRGDRHRRVHDNAERAVIRIGVAGVEVGYLGNNQKCQQDETHCRDGGQKPLPAAIIPAEECLECCQSGTSPLVSILPKNVFVWTAGLQSGCPQPLLNT